MAEPELLKLLCCGFDSHLTHQIQGTIMRYLIMVFILLAGCSSKYDECIEQQKSEFRQRNPKASFALMNSKQAEFEMMCSKFKGK